MLGGVSDRSWSPTERQHQFEFRHGDREETVISRIRYGSLGYERYQLCWPYHGQQAAHVPQRLCLCLWSVDLSCTTSSNSSCMLKFCLCLSPIWKLILTQLQSPYLSPVTACQFFLFFFNLWQIP